MNTRSLLKDEAVSVTLGSGNLRDAVRLPEGEDSNEWLAVNISDLFNQVTMLYGTISDQCSSENCPKMTAGPTHEYFWQDSTQKVLSTPASTYIDYLFSWVQSQLDDEMIFPSQIGKPFPRNFKTICESIMTRLFRVYAHIYHAHMARIAQLQSTAHLNTSFKHFILFAQQFQLISHQDMQPLANVVEKLTPS